LDDGRCTDAASCAAVLRATPEVDGRRVRDQEYAVEHIANFGGEGRAVIRELLGSPVRKQRWLGARAAGRVTRDNYEELVPALVQAFRDHPNEWELLEALHGIQDPRVLDALLEALPGSGFPTAVVRAIETLGAFAAAALPRLADIAASHWDAQLRVEAAEAFAVISGRAVEPAPFRCPVAVGRDAPGMFGPGTWTVTLRGSVVHLRSPKDEPPPRTAVCVSRSEDPDPGGQDALALRDDVVEPRYGSECRGALDGWGAGDKKRFEGGPGGPLLRREGDILAFGARDSEGGAWSVYSLTRSRGGEWSAHLAARASGFLVGYAVDAAGVDLLVSQAAANPMNHHVKVRPCASATRIEWKRAPAAPESWDEGRAPLVLLHIDADGVVTVRE
jgi:hypothetical protein